jgi:DNA-binding CsgD family transcriptional regulator
MLQTPVAIDPAGLSRLIGLAYEAPAQPCGWHEFADAVAEFLQTSLAMIHHMDFVEQTRAVHIAGGIDESFSQAFTPRWPDDGDDIYLQVMRDLPIGSVRLSSEIVAPEVARQSEIYQQLAAPWGLEYFLFASLGSRNGVTSVLSLGRTADDGPFTSADIELLTGALLPHVSRSINIAGIYQDNELLTAMIDTAPCGMVAFAANGQPVLLSAGAAPLFAGNRGLTLQNGALCAADPQVQAPLDAALRTTIAISQGQSAPPAAPVFIPQNGPTQFLQVSFSPFNAHTVLVDSPRKAACIALICASQQDRPPELTAALINAYGFSKAEARVCAALLTGKTTQETAATLNVSTNTVKTHLATIYQKTGVHSQTGLLYLLTVQFRTWN